MNGGLNVFKLVTDASIPVQLVMVLLLVFSFLSWVIIIRKYSQMKVAHDNAESFEERFWSGADLAGLGIRRIAGLGAGQHAFQNDGQTE